MGIFYSGVDTNDIRVSTGSTKIPLSFRCPEPNGFKKNRAVFLHISCPESSPVLFFFCRAGRVRRPAALGEYAVSHFDKFRSFQYHISMADFTPPSHFWLDSLVCPHPGRGRRSDNTPAAAEGSPPGWRRSVRLFWEYTL